MIMMSSRNTNNNQSILEGLIRAMQLTLSFKPFSVYKSIFLSTFDVQIGSH